MVKGRAKHWHMHLRWASSSDALISNHHRCSVANNTQHIADYRVTSLTSVHYHISLGALVPNSRDRHEKQWRPDFTRHKIHPKIRFV